MERPADQTFPPGIPALSQRPKSRTPQLPPEGRPRDPRWLPLTLPPFPLIGRPLPMSLFPSMRMGGSAAKTSTEQKRSSALLATALRHFPSNPRLAPQYLKRNGRSERLSARDGRKGQRVQIYMQYSVTYRMRELNLILAVRKQP